MLVDCYLGRVTPETLYADLTDRLGISASDAANAVDAAVAAECRAHRQQRLTAEREREGGNSIHD